jgi:hypothetical protein
VLWKENTNIRSSIDFSRRAAALYYAWTVVAHKDRRYEKNELAFDE